MLSNDHNSKIEWINFTSDNQILARKQTWEFTYDLPRSAGELGEHH